jgi:hypothetical protein
MDLSFVNSFVSMLRAQFDSNLRDAALLYGLDAPTTKLLISMELLPGIPQLSDLTIFELGPALEALYLNSSTTGSTRSMLAHTKIHSWSRTADFRSGWASKLLALVGHRPASRQQLSEATKRLPDPAGAAKASTGWPYQG